MAKFGYPGTGGRSSLDLSDLKHTVEVFWIDLSLKRHCPSRFMDCLDFHTVVAIIDATLSLRHLSLAFCKTFSEGIFSESLVLVIVLAVDLIALLMSYLKIKFWHSI